ncbi:hypothetical protein TNIN_176011 [Trichonephila inaurata madagascariensis]|uniref:Uncharacterized protein n=1 Tax=Trichonephila inaurata madagascariensis TaxID=2747483 RepID=A0A8X6Y1Z1_9ARAC|nr:hypothetical protein TNIN_176011 [Trichonephila inaurata madagascariensis]
MLKCNVEIFQHWIPCPFLFSIPEDALPVCDGFEFYISDRFQTSKPMLKALELFGYDNSSEKLLLFLKNVQDVQYLSNLDNSFRRDRYKVLKKYNCECKESISSAELSVF